MKNTVEGLGLRVLGFTEGLGFRVIFVDNFNGPCWGIYLH